MTTTTPRRTILVDDHSIVVQAAARLLADAPDFTVVGTATSGEEALELARETKPALVVLDLRLADCLGHELCRPLRADSPDIVIVIFTAYADDLLLGAAIREGVNGVLLKDVHEFDLVEGLRRVCAGERLIDERIGIGVTDGMRTFARRSTSRARSSAETGSVTLTPRELDTLRLIARGLSSRQIAAELNLAPNTVRAYSQSLLVKLSAHSRIEALANARFLKLI